MLERQAVDRVHRLGQTKEVISTSYIVSGSDSVEEVSTPSVDFESLSLMLRRLVHTEEAGVENDHDRDFARIQRRPPSTNNGTFTSGGFNQMNIQHNVNIVFELISIRISERL